MSAATTSTEVDQPSSISDVTWWEVDADIPESLDPFFWQVEREQAASRVAATRQRLFDWGVEQSCLRATRLLYWREQLLKEDVVVPPVEEIIDSD